MQDTRRALNYVIRKLGEDPEPSGAIAVKKLGEQLRYEIEASTVDDIDPQDDCITRVAECQ